MAGVSGYAIDAAREIVAADFPVSRKGLLEFVAGVVQKAIDASRADHMRNAGKVGGKARAKKLSKKRRSDIARQGAAVRWGNSKQNT